MFNSPFPVELRFNFSPEEVNTMTPTIPWEGEFLLNALLTEIIVNGKTGEELIEKYGKEIFQECVESKFSPSVHALVQPLAQYILTADSDFLAFAEYVNNAVNQLGESLDCEFEDESNAEQHEGINKYLANAPFEVRGSYLKFSK